MKPERKTELQEAIAILVDNARKELGPPPAKDEWLAYSRGEMAIEEAEQIKEFLANYPEFVRLLADLVAQRPEPGEPDYLTDEELERDWDVIKKRIPKPTIVTHPPQVPPSTKSTFRDKYRVAWEVAAMLLCFLAGGLVVGLLNVGGSPETVTEFDLLDLRRGGTTTIVSIGSDPGPIALIPTLINQPSFQDYRLELRRKATQEILLIANGLPRRPDDSFEVFLGRDHLSGGRYELLIYGIDGKRQSLLGTYAFSVGP